MKVIWIMEDDYGRPVGKGYITDATPRSAAQAYDLAARVGDAIERQGIEVVEQAARTAQRRSAAR